MEELLEENYYKTRLSRFEMKARKFEGETQELYTIKMELTPQGLHYDVIKEPAIPTNKAFMLPSTLVRHNDLLHPRNKQFAKGKRIYLEVVCYKEDIQLAQRIGREAMQVQIDREKKEIEFMQKSLLINS